MNLVATLAMAQVIFLAGIDASQDQVIKSSLTMDNKADNMLIMVTMAMKTKNRRCRGRRWMMMMIKVMTTIMRRKPRR